MGRFNVLVRGVGIPRRESYVELGLHAEAIVLKVYTYKYGLFGHNVHT